MDGVSIIFVLGAISHILSSSNATPNPLNNININLNFGKANKEKNYYESNIAGIHEDGSDIDDRYNGYKFKQKFKIKYRYRYDSKEVGEKCEEKGPLESKLPNGNGSVMNWIRTVAGLYSWEYDTVLGDAYFNTSACSQRARAHFTLAILNLHNFMYEQATELFWLARKDEMEFSKRDYPMAYWGAALASQHVLWKSSHCEEGREAVHSIPNNWKIYVTEREADYISPLFEMFPKDKNCEDEYEDTREKRYTNALEKVTKKYPDDLNAQLFYLIYKFATMGHPECIYGQPKYEFCQREIKDIQERYNNYYIKYPTNSGILHYITHVYDSPEEFSESIKKFTDKMVDVEMQHRKGIPVKVAYAYLHLVKSCHGQHMPSHLYLRIGNWKMSLKSNVASYKFWDEYAEERGFNFTYDASNLWHAIEFAASDFQQLGRYKEAAVMLKRIEDAIKVQLSMFDNDDEKVRYYRQFHVRVLTRYLMDIYTINPKKYPNGAKRVRCLAPGQSVMNDNIKPNTMIWTAIAEAGLMLTSGFVSARSYAKYSDQNEYKIVRYCIEDMEALTQRLNLPKYSDTMQYSKDAVKMFTYMLSGILKIAEAVKPNGFEMISQIKNDTAKKSILNELKMATVIQEKKMIQTSATPTLLYIPSFELYGHILLLFGEYSKARDVFARSVLERMGRTNSVIGLARSNALLENKEEATYFYKHVKDQLSEADEGNLHVKEANTWQQTKSAEKIHIYWPYI